MVKNHLRWPVFLGNLQMCSRHIIYYVEPTSDLSSFAPFSSKNRFRTPSAISSKIYTSLFEKSAKNTSKIGLHFWRHSCFYMVLFLNGGPEGSQDPPWTSRGRFSEGFGTLLGCSLTSRGWFCRGFGTLLELFSMLFIARAAPARPHRFEKNRDSAAPSDTPSGLSVRRRAEKKRPLPAPCCTKFAMVPPPRNLFFSPFNCITATSHDDVLRTARYRRGSRAPGGEEGARAAIEGLDAGALGSQLRYQVESRLA